MKDSNKDILHLRQDYSQSQLDEQSVFGSPIAQFEKWMQEALSSDIKEPNAMSLATINPKGRPESRIVLLRGFDTTGFRFFTNYGSAKAKGLEANPFAALTFFWPELERQIRIEGSVSKTSAEESDVYYNSRPRGNRLGAWASPQSEELADRSVLEGLHAQFNAQFEGKDVPRPENWGGFRLNPDRIEFWQGRPSRLHDRVCYKKEGEEWAIVRLAP